MGPCNFGGEGLGQGWKIVSSKQQELSGLKERKAGGMIFTAGLSLFSEQTSLSPFAWKPDQLHLLQIQSQNI